MNIKIAEELCVRFEGFRSKPYLCPAGVPTIGYGSTYYPDGRRVALTDQPLGEPEARRMLVHELRSTYLPGVLRLCPVLITEPGALNAIVDFAYNLGLGRLQTSSLRRAVNARDWEEAKVQLEKWVRGGGRVLPGLVARRKAEVSAIDGGK